MFLNVLDWKIKGNFIPKIKKAVVIVAPHTSWFDFIIGLFVRKVSGIEINYVGKKRIFFKPPFGWYFRWVGGTPLDRTSGQKKVAAIAQIFSKKKLLDWQWHQRELAKMFRFGKRDFIILPSRQVYLLFRLFLIIKPKPLPQKSPFM